VVASVHFEFATATRILFGPGRLKEVAPLVREFGPRALVVTGRSLSRAQPLLERLEAQGLATFTFSVSGEPTLEAVQRGTALARQRECLQVISIGGGSALDAGKAIAAMLTNPGDLLDYLEVIGRGQALARPPAPFTAIPTTAGTGSEVTRNAVLGSPSHRLKVSLRSPLLLPRLAVVDPELTHELPSAITARTGLDALTQLIEPFVSSRANPLTDALCRQGLRRLARSFRTAVRNGPEPGPRQDMCLASLFGGLALANAGLGVIHGLAGPLGGMFPGAPHGALCAALLPHGIAANCRALNSRAPGHPALERYTEVARLLTGRSQAGIDDGIEWVRQLVTDLRIPPLGTYGLGPAQTAELVEKANRASSMKANPVPLTPAELEDLLAQAR
jgi:alcohol dehydrogenase class IV